ncbi:MAG: YaiI/YqxD family protein [Longimicrobiales bacterium]
MPKIFVDADACPVKEEVYRVAKRYGTPVVLVANQWMRVPREAGIELVVVEEAGGLDDADHYIVAGAEADDVVVTDDIILASRCLEKGARALTPRGRIFTPDTIGEALATRELMADLREAGAVTGGPAPFEKRDRSNFLQRLDQLMQAARRGG